MNDLASDESHPTRKKILQSACDKFFSLGFDKASTATIAVAAGVSKASVYFHFDGKDELFRSALQEYMRRHMTPDIHIDQDSSDIRGNLGRFGNSYIGLLCNPATIAIIRTILPIGSRSPAICRELYKQLVIGPSLQLCDYLKRKTADGTLCIPDLDLAVDQFMQMCRAGLVQPRMLGICQRPTSDEIAKVVSVATDTFLSAYRKHTSNL